MAILVVDGQLISFKMSPLVQAAAFWPAPKATLEQVVSVEFIDSPWSTQLLQGVRAPGTGVPFVVMIGVMRRLKTKDFCVIKRKNPVAVITFSAGPFQRWIYTLAGGRHAEAQILASLPPFPSL